MQTLDDDCIRTILSKLPRMVDMRSFTDSINRKDLFAPAVVDRIESGSFRLVENFCRICNLSRTEHGQGLCWGCLYKRDREEESDDDEGSVSSNDTSTGDPTWHP